MSEGRTVSEGIDEISRMLGEVTAYIHTNRHGVNNLSQKMDALDLSVAKQISTLEGKLTTQIASMEARLVVLEADRQRRLGQFGILTALGNSRALGWVVGGITTVVAYLKGWLTLPPPPS